MSGLPPRSLLDDGDIPVAEVAALAIREGVRPREAYGSHRWFARRMASTARSLLVAAATPAGGDFWTAYYGSPDCAGVAVLDPFMGGGVMLLEASRLGADAIGVDVEPVAAAVSSFQGRLASLPDLAPHLADLTAEVGAEMAPFHVAVDAEGRRATMLHAFHVQTVGCCACGHAFDAHPRFRLAWDDRGGRQWVACSGCGGVVEAPIAAGPVRCDCGASTDPAAGRAPGGDSTCPACGHVEPLIAVGRRTGAPPRYRLFAVETIPDGPERRVGLPGRTIRTATAGDHAALARAAERLAAETAADPRFVADCAIPAEGRQDRRLVDYGYRSYGQMFNPRQGLHAGLLARAIARRDGIAREALAMAFSDHLATNNMFCAYAGGWRRLTPLFAIRAYRHIARPVELNPWLAHNGRGTFPNAVRAVARAGRGLLASTEPTRDGGTIPVPTRSPGRWDVRTGDARHLSHVPTGSVDLVLTDPPYFDYIAYSELGHWYVPWLARLGLVDAVHLDGFPAGQVASAAKTADRVGRFADDLGLRLREVARTCKPDARIAFTYQNRDGRGWLALGRALATAGMCPKVAFPMFGDGGSGPHKHANSVSWDCVVVCAPGGAKPPPDDLTPFADAGRVFMDGWRDRLSVAGHRLSPGDEANLAHAGAMVAALGQPSTNAEPLLSPNRVHRAA